MLEFLGRGGLFLCAAVIVFFARRLHKKSGGAHERVQKTSATILVFIGGLALMGTFVGDWMADLTSASPYLAAALFIGSALGLVCDWWTDGKPDKLAFWCAMVLPLAVVFGVAQLSNVGDEISKSGNRVSTTVNKAG